MPGAPFHTWKDLLLPNGQDTRVVLPRLTEEQKTPKISSFSLPTWNPDRLPPFAHLFDELPSRMREHLGIIVDQHYTDQAARTSFTNRRGRSLTPDDAIEDLRDRCADWILELGYEAAPRSIALHVSYLVKVIYEALTGSLLDSLCPSYTLDRLVITDRAFQFDDRILILWEDKSSRVFDRFIRELMEQMRDGSPVELCTEPIATTYRGYKAILAKLGYHASDIRPRIRWSIIFSGFQYMIIYIPRTPGRPHMYCSPVMQFCLRPDDEQEAAVQPPMWSILVYMVLVETLNIDDDVLRKIFGLVVPIGDPDLESKVSARGRRCSGRSTKVDETLSCSGKLNKIAERITVQCLDAYPMELLLVNGSRSHNVEKQYQPFIHLDRQLGMGWSSVFASSKSHVVVKFAVVAKKDKAELIRQLSDEKLAYNKLGRIAGWITPRLYGEYEWHGGRALVFSDDGQPLENFTSLPLIERLILFAEMYCIHYLGVEHGDFEPRNVVRKKWPCFLKIIDFGFSDVDHTCPGWRECGELKGVLENLQLDSVNFWFGLNHRLFLLSMTVFPLLAFAITSGIPANWRLWPQMQ